jgi:hypothetical protein
MAMRVLHVLPSLALERGGPPRSVAELARALTSKHTNCSIFAAHFPPGKPAVDVRPADAKAYPTSWPSRFWTGHSRQLFSALTRAVHHADLVHIHELWHFPSMRMARASVYATIALLVTAGAIAVSKERFSGTLIEEGIARTGALLTPDRDQPLGADASVSLRLLALRQYTSLIARRPVLGYGLGSTDHYYQSAAPISVASYNTYIEAAFSYGLFYLAAFLWLLLLLARHPRRRMVEEALHSNAISQLLAVVVLAGLVSNTVLGSRVLRIALLSFPCETSRTQDHSGGARPPHAPDRKEWI